MIYFTATGPNEAADKGSLVCYNGVLITASEEKRPPEMRPFLIGGDEGDRTPGLSIANAALSQLSYIPEKRFQVSRFR